MSEPNEHQIEFLSASMVQHWVERHDLRHAHNDSSWVIPWGQRNGLAAMNVEVALSGRGGEIQSSPPIGFMSCTPSAGRVTPRPYLQGDPAMAPGG